MINQTARFPQFKLKFSTPTQVGYTKIAYDWQSWRNCLMLTCQKSRRQTSSASTCFKTQLQIARDSWTIKLSLIVGMNWSWQQSLSWRRYQIIFHLQKTNTLHALLRLLTLLCCRKITCDGNTDWVMQSTFALYIQIEELGTATLRSPPKVKNVSIGSLEA